MSEIFLFIVLLYALSGVIPLCIRKKRIWSVSSIIMGGGGILLTLFSLPCLLVSSAKTILFQGEWVTFPICIGIDRLSALFCILLGMLSLAVALYTPGYLDRMHGNRRRYVVSGFIPLFLLSMLLVILAGTTIAFLVFWELMAILSFFLVLTEFEEEKTRYASLFYLAMTQISTVFVFLGILLMCVSTGSWEYPSHLSGSDPLISLSFLCLFFGIAIKSGVIPFHKWLPHAHPAAPSPVSALMSGMMISTALYALLRVVTGFYAPNAAWGFLILAFGCLSAVLGVMYALKEQDIKGLLAYSSIDNTGIILIGTGLWVLFTVFGSPALALMAIAGAVFHAISHGLFKGLLFLTAGSVCQAAGTRNIDEMGGILVRMPWTGGLFFIGVLSIVSIPPFSGFIGEFLIIMSLIGGLSELSPLLQIVMVVVLSLFSLTGALTVTTFVKAVGLTFLALPRSEGAYHAREVPWPMYAGPAVLALMSAGLGIFSGQIFSFLGYPGLLPDLLVLFLLLLGTSVLVYVAVWSYASRKTRITRTWDCGMRAPSSKMEYTGSGFTEPVVRFFAPVYRTRICVTREYLDEHQCLFRTGTGSIHLMKFFEECLYLPAARRIDRYASLVAALQNGDIDRFVLYVFCTVILLILILGWSA
ncbi:proton-conducting transporter membrane subunit [Methanospirillum hungatei]|uniref:proton-conducting transporter transmembrane domain-containing protein n=1 Tax=Methanospirillum hungatei TaxID=2203 RepID=UPI0026F0A812|nr:proton-conducting transporter membrane subunit [Methanospirillum hungatei]MCA1915464.1 hydrogenase membrane subunit [Methanospirillum hungatei]